MLNAQEADARDFVDKNSPLSEINSANAKRLNGLFCFKSIHSKKTVELIPRFSPQLDYEVT